MVRQLSSPSEFQEYDLWVKKHPQGTLWQSLEWKAYQEALGREVRIYAEGNPIVASALVVIDKTSFGLSTWDVPRGPIGVENGECPPGLAVRTGRMQNFLEEIARIASQARCTSMYFSPQELTTILNSQFSILNSPRHEQPPATRLIDLTQTEEQILAQMKQKGRYNIRVAQKHGIEVRQSTDVDTFASLAHETARRDGFTAPPASRYQKFLQTLPGAFLLLAYSKHSRDPIGGLLGVIWPVGNSNNRGEALGLVGPSAGATPLREKGAPKGKTVGFPLRNGIYYYGASDYTHRNLMAPYLLQWEAMKLCKALGCHTYDLLGISRPGVEDSWAGISRFKEQFGGKVIEYPPEQQITLRPWVSALLRWKRKMFCN